MRISDIIPAAFALLCCSAHATPVTERPQDFSLLQIVGTCMTPTLPDRHVVLVDEAAPWSSLAVGDIIKFRQGWHYCAHRIVDIRRAGNGERYVVTRGDNERESEIVTERQYKGRIYLPKP